MDKLKACLPTDDLIKAMRCCSGLDKGSCEHCPLDAGEKCWILPGFDRSLTVPDKLLRIAADRLEELNRRAEPENDDVELYLQAYQELLQKSMELNRKLIKEKAESKNSQL